MPVKTDDGTRMKRCPCAVEKLRCGRVSQIPERFASCSLESYQPRGKEQARAKEAIGADPDGSFFLWGTYGTGKTHLLYAQYRLMASSFDVRPLVRTTREIIQELTHAELEKGFVSPLLDSLHGSARLHLFWDDADKLKVTEFKLEVLFDLVDTIYRRNLGLTMTSNLPLDDPKTHQDLQGKLDPAIVRRIPEICRELEF